MKRHNRIEKAIIMSLLLSSSIYGVASAEDISTKSGSSITGTITAETGGEYNMRGGAWANVNGKNDYVMVAKDKGSLINIYDIKNELKMTGTDGGVFAAVDEGKITINNVGNLNFNITSTKDSVDSIFVDNSGNMSISNVENIYLNVENTAEKNGGAIGLYAKNEGFIQIGSAEKSVAVTQIITNTNSGNSYGIHADEAGTININTGSLVIESTNSGTLKGGEIAGILAGKSNNNVQEGTQSKVKIEAKNDVKITAKTDKSGASAILANKDGHVNLSSENGNVMLTTTQVEDSTEEANKYGIRVDSNASVDITAKNASISINVGNKENLNGNNYGIYSSSAFDDLSGGIVNLIAGKDIVINSYSQGSNYSSNGAICLGIGGKIIINAGNENYKGNLFIDSKSAADINNSTNLGIATTGANAIFEANVTGNVQITSDGYISQAIKADNGSGNSYGEGHFTINAGENIIVSAQGNGGESYGSYTNNSINKLIAEENIKISANNKGAWAMAVNIGGNTANATQVLNAKNVILSAINDNGSARGINAQYSYYENNDINKEQLDSKTLIDVDAVNDIQISASAKNNQALGIFSTNSDVDIDAEDGSTIINAKAEGQNSSAYAIYAQQNATNNVNNNASTIDINSGKDNLIYGTTSGVYAGGEQAQVNITSKNGRNEVQSIDGRAIYVQKGAVTNLIAKNGINSISSDNNNAIYTATNGVVSLDAKSNLAQAGDVSTGYGTGTVIQAMADSKINLTATDTNQLLGTVYAEGTEANITLEAKNNVIRSTAHGKNEGHESLVSALYVHDNGNVDITAKDGGYNYIASSYDSIESENGAERTIWAQQGGKINIEGKTFILAENSDKNTGIIGGDGHEQEGNSIGIAIAAGTGEGLDDYKNQDGSLIDRPDKERSTVNLDYSGDINGLNSYIKGDIVSGYGGLINIQRKDSNVTGGIDIQGNALAGNGGKLNIDLGNGGTWVGRADDYGDAGYGASAQDHQNFYNPAFSNEIIEGGTVNLTMGDNSTWYVNGQSWITSINTENAQNATIDLVEANTDRNNSAHALTVYNLNGNANINMSLDGNRDVSDMLYIKEAHGEYNIALADAVTTEDIYAGGLDGLRFATVGTGSDVKFKAGAYDKGFFNVEYEVGSDKYEGNEENHIYNGDEFDGEHGKVGDDGVNDFFDYGSETQTVATDEVVEDNLDHVDETTNYKLTGRIGEEISDAGKTIINMSRANYDQAVYMDNLNKRLGEARYLDGDEGVWVRMRHDKIDKDNGYEINNNMYELGYDKKYDSKDDSGYHRRGVAIDYMDGDTSYDGIGSGETNRKGLWFYDTWFGNKGHYTDYVAKWGHLENSFDLYTKSAGEKVNGEYNNDVYSLSAEWGYKDELKNGWYFEPQTQLQYARVTGADYETSQGTQVSLDGIDSLIARAGFRLGKDFGKEQKSTVYVKADVLHEFLGDQDITVRDKTTDGNILTTGYDNDGTWYSVGLGFSTMLSDNSYAFLDVEKLFGNDHDNSYQINGGFNWTF